MLFELAKLEPTASSEFYEVFLWRENEACVKKGHPPPFFGKDLSDQAEIWHA